MEKEETFELMPHKAFFEMKKDFELMKRNPFGPRTDEILTKINDLSKSLNLMIDAFKEANSHTQNQEVQDFAGMLNPVNAKMDAIIEQNKKIAQGILAVADIAKDALTKTSELEMKLTQKNETPREDFSQRPLNAPLNVPIPPPTASAFLNQQRDGSQASSQAGQQSQMSQIGQSNPFMPPPFPNQAQQKPMQSGFGGQPENKKAFKFYP